jgi:hypothetical protein
VGLWLAAASVGVRDWTGGLHAAPLQAGWQAAGGAPLRQGHGEIWA